MWNTIKNGLGSAYSWLGDKASVIPVFGTVIAASAESASAVLSGGSVTTVRPTDAGIETTYIGPKDTTPGGSPAQAGIMSGLFDLKFAGVPVVPVGIVVGGLLFLFAGKRGR